MLRILRAFLVLVVNDGLVAVVSPYCLFRGLHAGRPSWLRHVRAVALRGRYNLGITGGRNRATPSSKLGASMSKSNKPTISQHFVNLGAPLRNTRWGWGAVSGDGAVILRVWQDEYSEIDGRRFRKLQDPAWSTSAGFAERAQHVDLIRAGARGYMAIVTAVDTKASRRKIADFNPGRFMPIGELKTTPDGVVWGECLPIVDAIQPGA